MDGKKRISILITARHRVNFKLQVGIQMVHVRKSNEDDLNCFPMMLLASYMVYNPKKISYQYLYQNRTCAWDRKTVRNLLIAL